MCLSIAEDNCRAMIFNGREPMNGQWAVKIFLGHLILLKFNKVTFQWAIV
jgi:hypothetical protein